MSTIEELERRIARLEDTRYWRDRPDPGIFAQYETNTATAMVHNTWTLIDYEDKITDTHSAVTVGAAWKFTCPIFGYYVCQAGYTLATNTGFGVGERALIGIYKNGAIYKTLGRAVVADNSVPTTMILAAYGSITVPCKRGDYLSFYGFQNSGGDINLSGDAGQNYCTIYCRG